jgi:hypothetical protein
MRRISVMGALALAATLALAGPAAAKPKHQLGDRVEIRIHKNGWLGSGSIAYARIDYRCAPSPGLVFITGDVTISQVRPDGTSTGTPGIFPTTPQPRCTNQWRSAIVSADALFWGGPPFQRGPANVSVLMQFTDFVSRHVEGQASGSVRLR